MNVKSALLGTAAGLMVVSGAYAADLPGEAAPAAVDYVKVCDAYGAGFFYVPGSDTCLRIKGRVRASMTYTNNNPGTDSVNFRADGYVGFDARQSTDFGPLRSYIELGAGSVSGSSSAAFGGVDLTPFGVTVSNTSSSRSINLDQGFIQLGYVTVGRQDEVADGDGLYGINDATWAPGDFTATGASVLVDNLGGGFFVGAGVYSNDGDQARPNIWKSGESANYQVSGIVGINGQPWGNADLSGIYIGTDGDDSDVWGVKLTGNFTISDVLTARTWVAYTSSKDGADYLGVGAGADAVDFAAALAYQATKEASLYAGVRYSSYNDATVDDAIYTNAGVAYSLASNLSLEGEVDYGHTDDVDSFTAVTRLVRTW